MTDEGVKDLVVLAADKCIEAAVTGLLTRHESLRIRQISYDSFTHPENDSGCRKYAGNILGPLSQRYTYALVVFDRDGCGREKDSSQTLEASVRESLSAEGWGNRAEAVVIVPELEAWVWSDSPHVPSALGWQGQPTELRAYLEKQELWQAQASKPNAPKECVQDVLRQAQKPFSSAIFARLAQNVGLARCTDPAFAKLKQVLQQWFPAT
ncbi:MAG: methylation-associated defense system protein MAD4 [Candidatus Hydrogenedentota bacterium]